VKRSKNRSDVTRFWGSGDSTSKRILDGSRPSVPVRG